MHHIVLDSFIVLICSIVCAYDVIAVTSHEFLHDRQGTTSKWENDLFRFVFVMRVIFPSVSVEFARRLRHYEVTSPHRVTSDGNFLSHSVHHQRRRRRSSSDVTDEESLHFRLKVGGADLHLDLEPSDEFLSRGITVEYRPDNYKNISFAKFRSLPEYVCHFRGRVRGQPNSLVALATCDGLVRPHPSFLWLLLFFR